MPTSFSVPANNVVALVGPSGYTAGSGTLTLSAGQGSQFPALAANQYYLLTVVQQAHAYDPLATLSNLTIFKATGRSGDVFTGMTAVEGTTDRNYVGGDVVDVRVTAGKLSNIQTSINNLENSLFVCQGRLTIISGDPVNLIGLSSGGGTVYFTPYKGNRIALYDGSTGWNTIPFVQTGIAVPAVPNCYDVFAWNNGGTLALELGAGWSSPGFGSAAPGARTDALTLQDGIYVKQSNSTRRYLGTFYAQTGSVTYDYQGQVGTQAQRMLWNYYNRVRKYWYCEQGVGSWSYGGTAWRLFNANTGNNSAANLMCGLTEDVVEMQVYAGFTTSGGGTYFTVAISYDSQTAPSWTAGWNGSPGAIIYGNVFMTASYGMHQGLHYFGGLESVPSGGPVNVYAGGNGTAIKGWIWC